MSLQTASTQASNQLLSFKQVKNPPIHFGGISFLDRATLSSQVCNIEDLQKNRQVRNVTLNSHMQSLVQETAFFHVNLK